ncbi:hypothetical protein AGABI2DRAFT_116610 [Agaricus bisporus var. bisporus H97]|uniref:hypothetical protein n=1 Tax=Agaricus bisporus var. bisporus (strain H97 / ATCC MYA-4626 / FGSC 10389) TaxID=936046 RepID=UPI00029F53E0|nr:hypothetical protein AGABI2DRAFT_116610 [Agaricus bisporus var. bisporus H97]EKV49576.1 hypothetical protein AGABI2DRAFT_116610 [Agaricus bisporus var. bisporus H97]
MTMHPELKHAIDLNLSALELIRLFTKHHSGIPEEHVELLDAEYELMPSDCSFWDNWHPLLHKFYWYQGFEPPPISEAFLSIHKNLTREVISWLCDSGRRSNVYLIEEAQTPTQYFNENFRAHAFASICYDAHRFGQPLRDC